MDAIEDFIDHVTDTGVNQVPETAIRAAKTFILDSLGVGLSGGNGPWVREMVQLSQQWGQGEDARVWGHGSACRPQGPPCATPIKSTMRNLIQVL